MPGTYYFKQSLYMLLFTNSLQQTLAMVNATLVSQCEAGGSEICPGLYIGSFWVSSLCCSLEAASFLWWSLSALTAIWWKEVETADSVVPSSTLVQGGHIKAEAAAAAEITGSNAFSSTEHSILSHVARSILYLEFQFFFLFQLFLSRVLSTFPN